MFRAALVLVALAGPGQAGTVLVVDDFTDTAEIQLPAGPEWTVTLDMGELNADRTLTTSLGPASFRADVNVTRPGQFYVDMDYVENFSYIRLQYSFPTYNFSQYEALRLDITSWPTVSSDPTIRLGPYLSVRALDLEDYLLAYSHQRPIKPGRLVLPLDSFIRRGPPSDWAHVQYLEFLFGVSAQNNMPPWEIAIDTISFGPIPEPSTIYLVTGCVGWLVLSHRLNKGGGKVAQLLRRPC